MYIHRNISILKKDILRHQPPLKNQNFSSQTTPMNTKWQFSGITSTERTLAQ